MLRLPRELYGIWVAVGIRHLIAAQEFHRRARHVGIGARGITVSKSRRLSRVSIGGRVSRTLLDISDLKSELIVAREHLLARS
ncbi:MAG: hypothetical protein ABJB95_01845 [Gemmatimonadales bacterium]